MTLLHDLQLRGLPPASAVEGVHELLDAVGPVEPLARGEYERLLRESARARARLEALELRLLAAADRAGVGWQRPPVRPPRARGTPR